MNDMRSKKILTSAQLEALGSVTADSTFSEALVEDLIVWLSGTSRAKAEMMIGPKMMEGKIAILEDLGMLSLKTEKRKLEFKTIISKMRHANSGRVSVVHGVWRPTYRGIIGSIRNDVAKAINPRNKKAPPVPAARIEGIAREIVDAHNELFDFAFKVWISPKQNAQERAISRALNPDR